MSKLNELREQYTTSLKEIEKQININTYNERSIEQDKTLDRVTHQLTDYMHWLDTVKATITCPPSESTTYNWCCETYHYPMSIANNTIAYCSPTTALERTLLAWLGTEVTDRFPMTIQSKSKLDKWDGEYTQHTVMDRNGNPVPEISVFRNRDMKTLRTSLNIYYSRNVIAITKL